MARPASISAVLRAAIERAWWRPQTGSVALLLWPLSWLYGAVWRLRELAYATGLRRAGRAPVPVLVVGNLIVGGAGKTPTVIALVAALRRDGWTPGVVSRGYGSSAESPMAVARDTPAAACGDEPLLIHLRTGAPVWTGRRRVDAARALCAANPQVDVIVADDGLQHRALARDAQVVVFDGRGVGNGQLLPGGPLREPMSTAVPPRTTVIYNAATPSTPWPGHVALRGLAGALPLRDWWAGAAPRPDTLEALRGRPVLAAAGLAEPERFFAMLEAAGLTITRLPLPDHAGFETLPWPADAPCVVVTEKDAVKLPPGRAGAASVHVVTLDFRLPDEALGALRAWLGPPRQR